MNCNTVARLGLSAVVLVALLASLLPGTASAIPPFARTYDLPCSTCHTAITRRSEFGDVFRKSGFRWPGGNGVDARVQRPHPIEMKGVSGQKGLLPAQLPLGFVAQLPATWTNEPGIDDTVNFQPPNISLLFGGTLSEQLSFFGTWSGKNSPNEIYVHAGKLWGRPELNLRAGQFEQTTTLFKNNERLIQPFLVTTSSHTQHSIGASRRGAELNGILAQRTFYALGAVQNGGPGSNFDYYYHVSQKIGGMDLLGEEPDIDLDNPSFWEDITLTLGHYGYVGKVSDSEGVEESEIMRFGLDAKLRIYDLTLWAGAMIGLDRDLLVDADNESLTWFAESTYSITSWMLASYIYQYEDAADMEDPAQRHDAGFIFLPLENLRVRVKFGFTDDKIKNDVAEVHLLLGF